MPATRSNLDDTQSTTWTVGGSESGVMTVGSVTAVERGAASGPQLRPGAVIGHYVVRRRLGAGGMGEVFVAYDAQLDREIALKLIHNRLDHDEVLSARECARLRAEAQSLARLSHPNVVQIHEVGEHRGRTFLAMEYVDGPTLGSWSPRSLGQLLEVYAQAGRGLAAAHAAGLVHRDFKPSNVLIGADERVRVADFGLAINRQLHHEAATTLGDDDSAKTLDSRSAVQLAGPGTLMYMAPEQAFIGNGGPAADQFSFCVALFEAVYGARPFPARGAMDLLCKLDIGEVEFPTDPGPFRVPRWLRKLLLRGLARYPRDRFESMHELLGELTRDRAGRRRKLAVGGLITALTALVIGLGVEAPSPEPLPPPSLEGVWGEHERAAVSTAFGRVDAPWAEASENAAIAGLDDWAGNWLAVAREAQLSERVDPAGTERCLEVQRAQAELVIAALAHGEPVLLEGALAAVDALPEPGRCSLASGPAAGAMALGPARDELHPQLIELGNSAAQRGLGRSELAYESASLVLEAARAHSWADVELAALRQRGLAQLQAGRQAAGFDDLRRARELAIIADDERAVAELGVDLAWASRELLNVELRRDRLALAHAHVAQLEARAGSGPAARHARMLRVRVGLGQALDHFERGETDAAEQLLLRGLQILDALEAGETELALAHRHALVNTHRRARRFAEAERSFAGALETVERVRGPGHPSNATLWYDAGALALERGQLDTARERLTLARDIRRQALRIDHPALAHSELGLASLALVELDWERARGHAEQALASLEREGVDQDGLGEALRTLGQVAAHDGDWAAAQRHYERALELAPNTTQAATTELELGKALAKQGQSQRALEHLDRALPILAERLGPERCELLVSRYELQAETALVLGRTDSARRSLTNARACTTDPEALDRLDHTLSTLD